MSGRQEGRRTRAGPKLRFSGIIPAQASQIAHSIAWERAEQAMQQSWSSTWGLYLLAASQVAPPCSMSFLRERFRAATVLS